MMKAVQAELKPWHKALPKKRDSLQLEINKAQVGCLQEYVLRWVVLKLLTLNIIIILMYGSIS